MNNFIIYETINLINGKKYRGIHKTNNINDGYLGSGKAFKGAIKKYGKENFKRRILEFCKSYDELIEKEKHYVDENWINDDSNYNLKTGGQNCGILSIESRKKLSETLKKKYASGELVQGKPNLGKQMKAEIKNKISETLKTKYQNCEHPSKGKTKSSSSWKKGNVPWNKGLKTGEQSEDLKRKKSEKLKEKYKKEKIENIDHFNKGKVPWNKGKVGAQKAWNKGVKLEKIKCPHCEIVVDK